MSRILAHPLESIAPRLNAILAEAGQPPLPPDKAAVFSAYYSILHRWNAKISLTAIRSEEEILRRHFVESIAVARALPTGIQSLLDFGSGAGFPGLPVAICRPEILVVLAESQQKKVAFLREAVRGTGMAVEIFSDRAELIVRRFGCVTLRAVDRMRDAANAASLLVESGGFLALMTTHSGMNDLISAIGGAFTWYETIPLPSAEARILLLGRRA
ncbi:MAG TPA: 16S rRNA (guanine(527)-N(7))-methyltransferase RsmG [Terracidiphilus sp.]|jgi:16S rRNA (guanine527-N7)-methyltransferase|nr:16S rRNA (guanine(527)-N(7))-methyltransferase RsmG [Terracidiphilus sp.]